MQRRSGSIVHRPNAARRRDNAPIRPRRPATGVPDMVFALATVAWTMALVFLVTSFLPNDVTEGDAGRWLARIFAAALFISGLFLFSLGVGLLRDDRWQADHYVVPMGIGAIIGVLEAVLFLWPAGNLLPFPFILLIFALRPVRRMVSRRLQPAGGARR